MLLRNKKKKSKVEDIEENDYEDIDEEIEDEEDEEEFDEDEELQDMAMPRKFSQKNIKSSSEERIRNLERKSSLQTKIIKSFSTRINKLEEDFKIYLEESQ